MPRRTLPHYFKSPIGLDFEPSPADIQRFLRRVEVAELTGCWLWTASKSPEGYGRFSVHGGNVWAHRFSYAVFRRPLINGLTVEHKCGNTSCVNPWHFELMTVADNTAAGNRRRTKATEESETPF